MATVNTAEIKKKIDLKSKSLMISWQDSPSAQRLLDVIAGIIAKEYVQVAKQSPEVFSKQGTKK